MLARGYSGILRIKREDSIASQFRGLCAKVRDGYEITGNPRHSVRIDIYINLSDAKLNIPKYEDMRATEDNLEPWKNQKNNFY